MKYTLQHVRGNLFYLENILYIKEEWKTVWRGEKAKQLFCNRKKRSWQVDLLYLDSSANTVSLFFFNHFLGFGWLWERIKCYHKHHWIVRGNFIVCQIHKLKLISILFLPIPGLPKFLKSRHNKIWLPFRLSVIKSTAFALKQKFFLFFNLTATYNFSQLPLN